MAIRRCSRGLILVLILLGAGPVATALATYPGAAGVIGYQDGYSAFDPLNNGATSYVNSVRALTAAAGGPMSVLSCQGSDVGYVGEVQFCPESSPGFSPDGQTIVVAGVEYRPTAPPPPNRPGVRPPEPVPRG